MGLSEKLVREISEMKKEPEWMKEFRLKGLETFYRLELPKWGGDLSDLRWEDIAYYLKPMGKKEREWKEVPKEIKKVFDGMGIPEAEREILAGVETQFDSEVVYGSLKEEWRKKGVNFY